MVFKILFVDGTEITEDKCKWIDLPKKTILALEYILPNKKTLHLSGFDSYLHIKEFYKIVYGASGERLENINVLGKYGDNVYQFTLNLNKGKAKQIKNLWGKEFSPLKWNPIKKDYEFGKGQKTNRELWKIGMPLTKVICKIY